MKYELKKVLRWIIRNALIAGAMYVGITYNKHLATLGAMILWCNLAITIAAYCLIKGSLVQKTKAYKEIKPSVPIWVSHIFDVLLGGYLAWHGWPITGFSILCQAAVAGWIFEKAEELRSQEAA